MIVGAVDASFRLESGVIAIYSPVSASAGGGGDGDSIELTHRFEPCLEVPAEFIPAAPAFFFVFREDGMT